MIEHSPCFDKPARQPSTGPTADGDTPTQSRERVPAAAEDPMSHAESPPADANPETSQHVPSSLASELEAVRDLLASHSQRLDELVRIGDRREDQIDRLHEENQRLRAGEIALVQAPPMRELIRTYDLVLQLQAESGNLDLELVRRRLMDAFEQVGVRIFEPADGEAFDHDYHLAVDTMSTAAEEEHMTVVTTTRPGFARIGGEVVRPAGVRVRRYKRQPADHVEQSSDTAGGSGGQ